MKTMDKFAEIAAMGINDEGKGLITPQPLELEEHYLSLGATNKKTALLQERIDTKEKLDKEVERQKAYYRPFFSNHAPALETTREQVELDTFQWRIETEADQSDFSQVLSGAGDWEEVKLPHYGEPRGVATTYYRTDFELAPAQADESLWVSFKGVDYKAHIFLNGYYLGSHEGFFAPFEFEFTKQMRTGQNTLCVAVDNDYIHMGSVSELGGKEYTGDKIYAATGLGYDEPYEGWHHCPPGMGIYQEVVIERRKREFVSDVFVRPLADGNAEVWLEVFGCDVGHRDVKFDISVYGQNFAEVALEHYIYEPSTGLEVGLGDSLTEARRKADGSLGTEIPTYLERGVNYYKIPITLKGVRQWDLTTPWLYQVQVRLLDADDSVLDTQQRQFGFREFYLDTEETPRGNFYLNGRAIRLHGANSMGFEQQSVFKKDWEQLFTDIILAKVCNMNFLRMTQRPVQDKVYEFCDCIGMMLQTDLPMFGAIRRNQFAESIRQAQEMEQLIRSHPSAVLVSYINEPMPNAKNMPHRSLTRPELEDFFQCADRAVRLLNPDREIKHVDGDYDPPTEGLPDNHCYPCWYNGHGIDIGQLHKGYWMKVKEGWNYACGEYGIEGLEQRDVMEKYYPKDWLPQSKADEREWRPSRLPGAQTEDFHYFFYDTQDSVDTWIEESQHYQAFAVKLMTEAFRRDNRMVSFAYHLFIDAFPDGWMKTIMDVDRNPKQAFFAYRDALEPVLVSLRTDRFSMSAGEQGKIECWVCNDSDDVLDATEVHYQVLVDETVIYAGSEKCVTEASTSTFQGFIAFELPEVDARKQCRIQAAVKDASGKVINSTELAIDVFPVKDTIEQNICFLGDATGRWESLGLDMGWHDVSLDQVRLGDTIVVSDIMAYQKNESSILSKVKEGINLLFLELDEGDHTIGEQLVSVKDCSMMPLHFASRDTGHALVKDLSKNDIRYWCDEAVGYITPLLDRTFTSAAFEAVVTSANQDERGAWEPTLAVGEYAYGQGKIRISQLKLAGRTGLNPAAHELMAKLISVSGN